MSVESVEKIAATVLYEGYLLFPYRRSAIKNQQRWTFGGVYPRAYSEASGGDDPWSMQTQCLLVGDDETTLEVKVRFLHVAERRVTQAPAQPADAGTAPAQPADAGTAPAGRFVEELWVGQQVYRPWEEAIERTVLIGGREEQAPLRLGELRARRQVVALEIAQGSAAEPLTEPDGHVAGLLVREWQSLEGAIELAAEPLALDVADAPQGHSCYRLTIRIVNTTPWAPRNGETTMAPGRAIPRQTFVSTHTILRAQGGAFVSLLEPPDAYQQAAQGCANVKTWPVLAGDPGQRHTLLSSPIILYDYPQIAPESPGDLFDATEIDELLTLSIMTLTDEEKQEMRASDARGREILERTESLSTDQLIKLHGAIRSLQPVRKEQQ